MKNSSQIVIAGSGMMALSIGDFFLDRGFAVTWLTGNIARLEELNKRISRARKRLTKYVGDGEASYRGSCLLLGVDPLPTCDLVIEATSEDLAKKRRIAGRICRDIGNDVPLCTNSSSIVPQAIGPDWMGLHFFYPVSVSTCTELLLPADCNKLKYAAVTNILDQAGCSHIVLPQDWPFLANRLLVPLQSACFQALVDGFSPQDIDRASVSELLPVGQLRMMDTIGLDIMQAAIASYRQLPALGEVDFAMLQSCLDQLVVQGKKGTKNRNGLLQGDPLPWSEQDKKAEQVAELAASLHGCFVESCRYVYINTILGYDELRTLCECVFGSDNYTFHIQL